MPIPKFCAVLCCMGMVMSANAQRSLMPPISDTAKIMELKDITFSGNPLIRRALVDSLNRQRIISKLPVIKEPLAPFGQMPHLYAMKDTVKQQFFAYVKSTAGAAKTEQFIKGMGVLKDTARLNSFLEEKLRGFYALAKDDGMLSSLRLPGKPENKLTKAGVETSYGDTTGNSSGWWSVLDVQDRVTAGSIPVNLQYANVSGYSRFDSRLEDENLVKFNFDKDAYIQKLNAHLHKNYDLKKYFLDDIDFKSQLKAFIEHRVKSFKTTGDSLYKRVKPEELMYLDSTQLRNVVFDRSTLVDSLRQIADSSLQNYYTQLLQLKKEIGGGLEMNQLLNSQHAMRNNLQQWMNDPAAASQLAGNLVPMSGLQRLFMKIKDLNAGQIAANASKGTVSDLFMSGVAGSMLSKNKFLMTAIGKTREMTPRDIGLNASMDAPARSMQFLRLGQGDIGNGHTHISALNANARNSPGRAPNVMALAQNTFVGAFSKGLNLGTYGKIEAEFSKSSNTTGGNGPAQEHTAVSKAAVAHFFDDFLETASAGLNYTGGIDKWRTAHTVYINYSGMGYNNPGNPYARRGTFQYGLQIKKSWPKNKGSLHFRSDVKNMSRSAVTGSQWKNYTFSLDGRYRLSRQLSFSGRLHQSKMNAVRDAHTESMFLNRKISFSSQLNSKLWHLPYSGHTMIGLQQLNYEAALQPVRSLFVNTQLSHQIAVGSRMISANLFYNRDIKNAAIYSNLLNVDAGYHYTLVKLLQCSSSLTYLDNKDVVRQLGVRQQIGAQLLKRVNMNVSVDARKDLLQTPQNYLYGNFRTEMSFHYLLN